MPRTFRSHHTDNDASKTASISRPTTEGSTQNISNGTVKTLGNEPIATHQDLQQVKSEPQNFFNILLANNQQGVNAAVGEQIRAITSNT